MREESQLSLLNDADTLAPIKALHRGADSYVGFARKGDGGKFEGLFSLQIAEIEAMFPSLAGWLIRDAYFTVNGLYRAAPFNSNLECEAAQPAYGREVINRGAAPKRLQGMQVLNARRAQDMATLETFKGGWQKGGRLRHLALYANFLRGAGTPRDEVLMAVRTMAANCHPAYPSDRNDMSLTAIVAQSFDGPVQSFTDTTLCALLNVTSQIARDLELMSILPPEVRIERSAPHGGQRAAERTARRDALQEYLKGHGAKSSRQIAGALRQQGFDVSDRTVNNDLNALGCVSITAPARRAGRRKASPQSGLPLECPAIGTRK
jgi:hypothetical protein